MSWLLLSWDHFRKCLGLSRLSWLSFSTIYMLHLLRLLSLQLPRLLLPQGFEGNELYNIGTSTIQSLWSFDGVLDPIFVIRWLSDVEGCLFTCSCLSDQKVKCALNLLQSMVKDWWRLVTRSYTPKQCAVITWEQFLDMFHMRYVPLGERTRLAQEYLDLRQGTELVIQIANMLTKTPLFCLDFAASKHAQMTQHLSMLKTDILQFVST